MLLSPASEEKWLTKDGKIPIRLGIRLYVIGVSDQNPEVTGG